MILASDIVTDAWRCDCEKVQAIAVTSLARICSTGVVQTSPGGPPFWARSKMGVIGRWVKQFPTPDLGGENNALQARIID